MNYIFLKSKIVLFTLFFLITSFLYADVDIVSSQEALPKIAITKTININCPKKAILKFDKSLRFDMSIVPYFKLKNQVTNIVNNDFEKWKKLGVEYLFTKSCVMKNKKMNVEVTIFSPTDKKAIWKKLFIESYKYPHRFAHFIANDIYGFFSSGKKGIFLSKIVYAKKVNRKKQIFTMSIDNSNVRAITKNRAINMLPMWAGKNILFTSYLKGSTDLYMADLKKGRIRTVSSRSGLNVGGVLSPDGKKIVVTLSKDGNSEIYLLDKYGKLLKRLTRNRALDTSPNWSPDGKKITFVSNRHGNPHIFIMNSDGSDQKRLTFQGTYNQTPQWSPQGDRILFTGRDERNKFDIFYIDLTDNNKIVRLTQGNGHNEEPSYSPDGEFIMFLSSRTGTNQIFIMDKDGKRAVKVTNSKSRYYTPRWSTFF